MKIKYFFLLIAAFSFSALSNELFNDYEKGVKRASNAIVYKYFGPEASILRIDQSPVGTYKIVFIDKSNIERTLFLLQDLKHFIEGQMYSPLTADVDQANGNEYLTEVAKRNAKRKDVVSGLTRAISEEKAISETQESTNAEKQIKLEGKNTGVITNRTKPLVNTSALNFTTQNKSPFIYKPKSTPNELLERVKSATTISVGSGEKDIYVFLDVECPTCAYMHPFFMAAKSSNVTIHFVPVGFMSKTSPSKAILVYSKPNNRDRLEQLKESMGNIPLADLLDPSLPPNELFESDEFKSAAQIYIANLEIFRDLPVPLTPTLIFDTENGAKIMTAESNALLQLAIKQAK